MRQQKENVSQVETHFRCCYGQVVRVSAQRPHTLLAGEAPQTLWSMIIMQQCACVLQTSRRTAAHAVCDQWVWAADQQVSMWIRLSTCIACDDRNTRCTPLITFRQVWQLPKWCNENFLYYAAIFLKIYTFSFSTCFSCAKGAYAL